MAGRAQRYKVHPKRSSEDAADIMMEAVVKYVAGIIHSTPAREKELVRQRLNRLLDQTAFIAGIMTGEHTP